MLSFSSWFRSPVLHLKYSYLFLQSALEPLFSLSFLVKAMNAETVKGMQALSVISANICIQFFSPTSSSYLHVHKSTPSVDKSTRCSDCTKATISSPPSSFHYLLLHIHLFQTHYFNLPLPLHTIDFYV